MNKEKPPPWKKHQTCRAAGQEGGNTTLDRHGAEHYAAAGQIGGSTTYRKYGPEHYAAIGRKGGSAKRKGTAVKEEEVDGTEA